MKMRNGQGSIFHFPTVSWNKYERVLGGRGREEGMEESQKKIEAKVPAISRFLVIPTATPLPSYFISRRRLIPLISWARQYHDKN